MLRLYNLACGLATLALISLISLYWEWEDLNWLKNESSIDSLASSMSDMTIDDLSIDLDQEQRSRLDWIHKILAHANFPPTHVPWMRWSASNSSKPEQDLQLSNLLEHLEARIEEELASSTAIKRRLRSKIHSTNKTIGRQLNQQSTGRRLHKFYQDHLYIINNGSLYFLQDAKLRSHDQQWVQDGRWGDFQIMIQSALDLERSLAYLPTFRAKLDNTTKGILDVLLHENISIPLMMDPHDWRGCGSRGVESWSKTYYNYPIFSLAMSAVEDTTECVQFTIPYGETWNDANDAKRFYPFEWDLKLDEYRSNNTHDVDWATTLIPFEAMHMDPEEPEIDIGLPTDYFWVNKIPKVGWRGSSTGIPLPAYDGTTNFLDLPRFRLLAETWDHPDLFDVYLVALIQGWESYPYTQKIEDFFHGSIIKSRIEFLDFQKFKGVLDVQGNSWSSRLGRLMCMNSVILRVS